MYSISSGMYFFENPSGSLMVCPVVSSGAGWSVSPVR